MQKNRRGRREIPQKWQPGAPMIRAGFCMRVAAARPPLGQQLWEIMSVLRQITEHPESILHHTMAFAGTSPQAGSVADPKRATSAGDEAARPHVRQHMRDAGPAHAERARDLS